MKFIMYCTIVACVVSVQMNTIYAGDKSATAKATASDQALKKTDAQQEYVVLVYMQTDNAMPGYLPGASSSIPRAAQAAQQKEKVAGVTSSFVDVQVRLATMKNFATATSCGGGFSGSTGEAVTMQMDANKTLADHMEQLKKQFNSPYFDLSFSKDGGASIPSSTVVGTLQGSLYVHKFQRVQNFSAD